MKLWQGAILNKAFESVGDSLVPEAVFIPSFCFNFPTRLVIYLLMVELTQFALMFLIIKPLISSVCDCLNLLLALLSLLICVCLLSSSRCWWSWCGSSNGMQSARRACNSIIRAARLSNIWPPSRITHWWCSMASRSEQCSSGNILLIPSKPVFCPST